MPGPDAGVPPSFPGGGQAVLAASREHGLEGVVLKQLDSLYLPGRRSPLWLKVKNERIADVVIGGWIPGHGARPCPGLAAAGRPGPGRPGVLRESRDRLH